MAKSVWQKQEVSELLLGFSIWDVRLGMGEGGTYASQSRSEAAIDSQVLMQSTVLGFMLVL